MMRAVVVLHLIVVSALLGAFMISSGFCYSHDFRAIQHHEEPPSRGLLEFEILKRQEQEQADQRIKSTRKAIADGAETVNAASGPVTNSAGGVKDALLKELSRANRGRQIKIIKQVFKTDKKGAVEILQKGGKNFTAVADKLDALDKAGTLASVAGALSGGDVVGVAEAVGNATASGALAGASAAAGAAAGAEAGTFVGALIGGPVGAPVGAAVGATTGAVIGAIGSSVAYNEYIAPNVEKVGDHISKQYQAWQEEGETKRRRIRTDFNLVYGHGHLSSTGYIDTDELHEQAQQIRDQRNSERMERHKQQVLDEINSVNGMLIVPDVAGKSKKDAEGLIRGAGFTAKVVEEQAAPRQELVGKVYSQMPSAKSAYPVGSFVTVIALVYSEITIDMPGVIGLKAQKARDVLEAAGLTVAAQVGKEPPDPDSEYKVFAQKPEPEKPVAVGQSVSLSLYGRYQGETVPAVVGLGKLEATLQMEAAGLRVTTVPGNAALSTDKVRTVQKQSLVAGKPVSSQGGDVVLTLFASCEKSDRCKTNQHAFYAAYQVKNYDRCREILTQSQDCAFHDSELAALNQLERHKEQSQFCQEQLVAMDSALRVYNWDRFKGILAQSKSCSFYADYLGMATEVEKRAEQRKQQHDRFHEGMAQIFGSAVHSALSQSVSSHKSKNPSKGSKNRSGSYRTYQADSPNYLESLSRD
ncbi:PASTA domain-containing protein [Desulfuromonas acetoxidans]|uniref:PASTA domain-containing protein n=1 Tax=Desulfuromonas acetoxidans TaxID=891 RepID=UPI0029318764|nr:PASTA domain-containing protein [Desulfuromonas acetoxidans]